MKKLVEHLKYNSNLQKLDLRHHDVTSIGAGYLIKWLTDTPCTVNDIRLNDNPLEDKGIDLILQAMPLTMKWLSLHDTEIRNDIM